MKTYVAKISDDFKGFPVYAWICKSKDGYDVLETGTTPKGLAEIILSERREVTISRQFYNPPKAPVLFYGGHGETNSLTEIEKIEFQKGLQEIIKS